MFRLFAIGCLGILPAGWVAAGELSSQEAGPFGKHPYAIMESYNTVKNRYIKIHKDGKKVTKSYTLSTREPYSPFLTYPVTVLEQDSEGRVLREKGTQGEEIFYMYLPRQMRRIMVRGETWLLEEIRLNPAYIQRQEARQKPVGVYRYVGFSSYGKLHGVFADKKEKMTQVSYCYDMDENYHCGAFAYVRLVGGKVVEEQELTSRQGPDKASHADSNGYTSGVDSASVIKEKVRQALLGINHMDWESLRQHLISFAEE